MAIVGAGKFMMRIVTFKLLTNKEILGKPLDWEEARKKVFKRITGVEGTPKEFRRINKMLGGCPVFKQFEIEERV